MAPRITDIDDTELVAAIARGERAAVATLYDRYGSLTYSLVLRIVRAPERAEEIVQDAFLTAWRRAATFDPERASVVTWLVTIARNRAIDELRRMDARPQPTGVLDDVTAVTPTDDGPLAVAVAHERATAVRAVLQALPQSQREAIALAYFGGLSQNEIAERTGAPLGTVKTRMFHGMRRLRELLQEAGVHDDASR